MKPTVFGLTLVGLAAAAPCSIRQTELLGRAIIMTSTCDDIKAITDPNCQEGGQDVSALLATHYNLCVQMGHTEWLKYILDQGDQGSGSGDMGSGSGSGSGSGDDCVGPDCCTDQQKLEFFFAAYQVDACADVLNLQRPNCTNAPDLTDYAGFCNTLGLAAFKENLNREMDKLVESDHGGNGNGSGDITPPTGSGSGNGSGSGSGNDCVGPDCCTVQQKLDMFKAMEQIKACSDVDKMQWPDCQDAPAKVDFSKFCVDQGLEKLKEQAKKEVAKLSGGNAPSSPPTKPPTSAAPGVTPLVMAFAAPLLALYFAL